MPGIETAQVHPGVDRGDDLLALDELVEDVALVLATGAERAAETAQDVAGRRDVLGPDGEAERRGILVGGAQLQIAEGDRRGQQHQKDEGADQAPVARPAPGRGGERAHHDARRRRRLSPVGPVGPVGGGRTAPAAPGRGRGGRRCCGTQPAAGLAARPGLVLVPWRGVVHPRAPAASGPRSRASPAGVESVSLGTPSPEQRAQRAGRAPACPRAGAIAPSPPALPMEVRDAIKRPASVRVAPPAGRRAPGTPAVHPAKGQPARGASASRCTASLRPRRRRRPSRTPRQSRRRYSGRSAGGTCRLRRHQTVR